jgi:hypothetical protein
VGTKKGGKKEGYFDVRWRLDPETDDAGDAPGVMKDAPLLALRFIWEKHRRDKKIMEYIDSSARLTLGGGKVIPRWSGIESFAREQGWEGAPPKLTPKRRKKRKEPTTPPRSQEENERRGMKRPPPTTEDADAAVVPEAAVPAAAAANPAAADTSTTRGGGGDGANTTMPVGGAGRQEEERSEEETEVRVMSPSHRCEFEWCHDRTYVVGKGCLRGKGCLTCGRRFVDTAVKPRPADGRNTATEFWPSTTKPGAHCPMCKKTYCWGCGMAMDVGLSPRRKTRRGDG